MKKILAVLLASFVTMFVPSMAAAADSPLSFKKLWTIDHSPTAGQVSEIPAFDHKTNTLWIAGIVGVDVLDAKTGTLVEHIDTTRFGQVNSVAIHEGLAALAIEATTRTSPGVVVFYDTKTRALAEGVSVVTAGALPDMLTFTPDGKKLLVGETNEGTPAVYGARIGTTVPRVFGSAAFDPPGSVTIIDVKIRQRRCAGQRRLRSSGSMTMGAAVTRAWNRKASHCSRWGAARSRSSASNARCTARWPCSTSPCPRRAGLST